MKNHIIQSFTCAIFLLLTSLLVNGQITIATNQFYIAVNQSWSDRDYPQILTLIDSRLQSQPNDVLALMLKANYYVFAEKNINQAHQLVDAFLLAVNSGTTDQKLQAEAQAMAKRINDIPITDTTQFTQQQRDAMHATLMKFPLIDESLIFWGEYSKQI